MRLKLTERRKGLTNACPFCEWNVGRPTRTAVWSRELTAHIMVWHLVGEALDGDDYECPLCDVLYAPREIGTHLRQRHGVR